jgi:hypothetical protein
MNILESISERADRAEEIKDIKLLELLIRKLETIENELKEKGATKDELWDVAELIDYIKFSIEELQDD